MSVTGRTCPPCSWSGPTGTSLTAVRRTTRAHSGPTSTDSSWGVEGVLITPSEREERRGASEDERAEGAGESQDLGSHTWSGGGAGPGLLCLPGRRRQPGEKPRRFAHRADQRGRGGKPRRKRR